MTPRVLEVSRLKTAFKTPAGMAYPVDDVSLYVDQGEVLAIVGESGSGKSMTAYSLMGLVDAPGQVVGGSVLLNGSELRGLNESAFRKLRGNRIAMIFQDPMATLNPVLTIRTQMVETLAAHRKVTRRGAEQQVIAALEMVGIASAAERLDAYPHQFSGGMRQRVCIAIALLNHPDLIICDEPTTALDVTIQSQILAEMQTLCRERGTALIWITHDLSIVAGLADRVAVMYAGRIVEAGSTHEVIDDPRHPYTRGLIDSTPAAAIRRAEMQDEMQDQMQAGIRAAGDVDGAHPARPKLVPIPGFTPALTRLPQGCAFHPRCSRATSACLVEPRETIENRSRSYRCFHPIGGDAASGAARSPARTA